MLLPHLKPSSGSPFTQCQIHPAYCDLRSYRVRSRPLSCPITSYLAPISLASLPFSPVIDIFLPQGLCTGSSHCLESPSTRNPQGSIHHFLHVDCKVILSASMPTLSFLFVTKMSFIVAVFKEKIGFFFLIIKVMLIYKRHSTKTLLKSTQNSISQRQLVGVILWDWTPEILCHSYFIFYLSMSCEN